jgi:enoyl-CoA hydratase/carnithine racemase
MTTVETRLENRVLHIALNRPEKRNALNMQTCQELADAFDNAERDNAVGCILLSGNGAGFCSGMDLAEAREADPLRVMELQEKVFTVISRTRTPIVAAVHGPALAGGTGLAANAHIIVAAPDAKFGMTEIRVGLWPVLVYRPVELAVGERRATELCLTGRLFGAEQAREYGLVTEIHSSPLERGLEIAIGIAANSPVALRAGLDYLHQIRMRNWEQAGRIGWHTRELLTRGADFEEGTRAFLEKRKPDWPSLHAKPTP